MERMLVGRGTDESLFRGRLVRLAVPREEDAEAFSRWSEDAGYVRNLDTAYARPVPARGFAERFDALRSDPQTIEFHLRTLEEDRLIGFVAVHSIEWNNRSALLAIGIGEADYRGKGYGADALQLILGYAFRELNLHRLGLDVISSNQAAIRAYEKAGFRREGVMRQAVLRDGRRYHRVLMGILREEWSRDQEDIS
jgi:RimJ/RimL family protein N-acetyltransferase